MPLRAFLAALPAGFPAAEELQSTSEELETMNEELQSTNDELQTINEELRRRTSELNKTNGFLGSVMRSLGSAVIVLTEDLCVKVWSPGAADMWGLRPDETLGKSLLALDIGAARRSGRAAPAQAAGPGQ